MQDDFLKNSERFTGFADIYDRARPTMPFHPVSIAENYLERKTGTVIDLGCGTGLSTLIWRGNCERIIGIEPSADMIFEARKKESGAVSFVQAYAHETGLDGAIADVAVCSQSFHWMEPVVTLKEINRILKPDGIFMTVDCDWPPVINKRIEFAYSQLTDKIHQIERDYPEIKESFNRWEKSNHLSNMKNSGYFRFCREILFLNTEDYDKYRIYDLVLSQGSTQTVLKKRPELISEDLENFRRLIECEFEKDSQKMEISFCYRIRIGVK